MKKRKRSGGMKDEAEESCFVSIFLTLVISAKCPKADRDYLGSYK